MRRVVLFSALAFAVAFGAARAGLDAPPAVVDTSNMVSRTELDALRALIPAPSTITPPMDAGTGSPGADAGAFMRADAVRPRITRSINVQLNAAGTAVADWSGVQGGALPTPAIVNLTPVASAGGGAVKCWLTAVPTTTQAAIRCVREQPSLVLSTAVITSGIDINGVSASGMTVQVIALPGP